MNFCAKCPVDFSDNYDIMYLQGKERKIIKMLVSLLKIDSLAWCPGVGIIMIAVACLYFMLMLVYAIIAECCNLPMPLDDTYLIGKINDIIMIILMVGGLAFFII